MKTKLTTKLLVDLKPKIKSYEVRDTEAMGLFIRVQPTGSMTYYCEYRNRAKRKQRYKIAFVRDIPIQQARDEARRIIGQVVSGADPAEDKRAKRGSIFKDFIEQEYSNWVETKCTKPKSVMQSIATLFAGFYPYPISEITPHKIDRWISERKSKGMTNSTINRNLTLLKGILSRASEWGYINESPMKKIRNLKVDTNGIVRFLSPDEVKRLNDALQARNNFYIQGRDAHNEWLRIRGLSPLPDLKKQRFVDHIEPMILIAMNTGLRKGELFKLKWQDIIEVPNQQLVVRGSNAKSFKTRVIPLNQVLRDTLIAWRSQSDPRSELIFPSHTGAKFDNIETAWKGLLKRAEIIQFRWHDFRHHFASQLAMAGVDLNTIRELLGHSDLKMVLRYAHLCPKHLLNAVEILCPSQDEQRTSAEGS